MHRIRFYYRLENCMTDDSMSHMQYLNVLHLCRHLEHVAEAAYAVSFHLDMHDVTFTITPQNRLEINSAADVKALCDADVFPVHQRSKLQKQLNDYLTRMEDLKLRQAELKDHSFADPHPVT